MNRLILQLLPFSTACVAIPAVAPAPTAGLGETASVGGIRVRPLRVVEDSRCPINARCIWAGRIILLAEVSGGPRRTTYSLTLGEPIDHGGGRLALVAAEPGRIAGRTAEAGEYRFTFAFEPL